MQAGRGGWFNYYARGGRQGVARVGVRGAGKRNKWRASRVRGGGRVDNFAFRDCCTFGKQLEKFCMSRISFFFILSLHHPNSGVKLNLKNKNSSPCHMSNLIQWGHAMILTLSSL